jgi:pimeloyl-ACP methyl ester carboxylesterase
MLSEFTPVPKCSCAATCRVPYMAPDVAAIEDDILAAYLAGTAWPADVLSSLEMQVCCAVANETAAAPEWPTVFFGSGLNTTRFLYSATAQHIASKGYRVLVLDHPYETDVVQFPDGEIIFGGRVSGSANDTALLELGLDVRAQDVSFVLDTYRIPRTVYIGHSFGGASAASALLTEPRIQGGVNLDGALWGPVVSSGVPRPFLSFGSVGHNSSTPEEPSWASFYAAMAAQHADVWTRELSVEGTLHNSYSDFALIADVAGLRGDEALVNGFFGQVTGERVMTILKEYISDFVEFAMGSGEQGLLEGESEDYPDVIFVI